MHPLQGLAQWVLERVCVFPISKEHLTGGPPDHPGQVPISNLEEEAPLMDNTANTVDTPIRTEVVILGPDGLPLMQFSDMADPLAALADMDAHVLRHELDLDTEIDYIIAKFRP